MSTPNFFLKRILFLTVLLSLLFGCGGDTTSDNSDALYADATKDPDSNNASFTLQNIVHNGVNREYFLYIPDSYDGSSAVPVLFNFHGYGGNANEFMSYTDMRAQAESNTFILVYPQGSVLDGSTHWNACPTGGDNKSTADDFGFTESMINEISSQYSVDLQRIYAAGYSNGGMMAYGLANYKSELIAAVASISGSMLDCTENISHPMPVLHLHGTADMIIPYNGNRSFNSVESTLNYWINFNNTTPTATVSNDTSSGISIEHYIYDQGDSSVSVEHYKYIGGGHVWFGSTYQNQNASDLIWNFFSQYDIYGKRQKSNQ
jgi:polyhydroxybutyrate depolymerase